MKKLNQLAAFFGIGTLVTTRYGQGYIVNVEYNTDGSVELYEVMLNLNYSWCWSFKTFFIEWWSVKTYTKMFPQIFDLKHRTVGVKNIAFNTPHLHPTYTLSNELITLTND